MSKATEDIYHERIRRVLLHIQRRLDDALTLEGLSRVARFSPYHFHRIFKALVGESVMAHIRRLRLERAAGRLRKTQALVVQVAFEAGYSTHEAFTRAFKTAFGLSPSAFRRRGGPIRIDSPSGVHYAAEGQSITYRPPVQRGAVKMDVRIETRQPVRVAFARHVGAYPECQPAWDKLHAWAEAKGVQGSETGVQYFLGSLSEGAPSDVL